jgi:hypothetical protein
VIGSFVRRKRHDIAALFVCAAVAVWLVSRGLGTGMVVGTPYGEVWGRLFVTGQVGRWATGGLGWADLLSAPDGQAFWPVDPVLQLGAVPLSAMVGDATAWALVLGLLSFSTGLGAYGAARYAGGGVPAGLASAAMLQLNPLWLRHAAEGVTEVLALGLVAIAGVAGWHACRTGGVRPLLVFAVAAGAVAGVSPYYAVFTMAAVIVAVAARPRRRHLAVVATGLAACALVAVPLVVTELGDGGRMSGMWAGGYRLVPDELVRFSDQGLVSVPRRPTGFGDGTRPWFSWVVQWHGGVAATVVLIAGLLSPRARFLAGIALVWLALGPGWTSVATLAGRPDVASPLAWAAGSLALGNPSRLAVVPVVAAPFVLGLAGRGPWLAALVGALSLVSAVVELPPLRLPAVHADPLDDLAAVIDGPVATFPSGDPPLWHPSAWPKETLWLATHHGGPTGSDYGRGGLPADGPLLVRLSQVSGVALGRAAAETLLPSDDRAMWASLQTRGYTRVLVVRRGLTASQWQAVAGWLETQAGPPIREVDGGAVWAVP